MGQPELIAIGLFTVPVGLVLFMRANAVYVFMSMCVGYAVGQLLGPDLQAFAEILMPGIGVSNMKLLLVALPAVLTALFYTRSVKGSRAVVNVVSALSVGLLALVVAVPLLAPITAHGIMELPLWRELVRLQALLVGGSAVVCLLLLWLQRPGHNKSSGEKKHS